jgi:N-acetylglucosamine-6-phosphate deacetylase
MVAITAHALLTPLEIVERPMLFLEGSAIAEVATIESRPLPKCRTIDFGDAVIAPGLVDMHIHGAAGHDVMENDSGALASIERLLAQHGVTSYVPTTVTAPLDTLLAALDRLASRIEADHDRAGARPVGIHLEGPFISHLRRGVHPPENLLAPSLALFERFWQAARGHIRVMTIAPELDGALELIAEAARRGVCVSLGHSDADLAATRKAVQAGARHATHTFNAMRPMAHRDPGIAGEVLSDSTLTADIIADGIHVDPALINVFLKCKGVDGSVLITDATAATGMPDGRYRLGAFEIEVKDGRCLANGVLAGSVLTMDRAVRNVMSFGGWTLRDAVRAACLNPARRIGLNDAGAITAGSRADIAVLSPTGEVRTTIVGGRVSEAAKTS